MKVDFLNLKVQYTSIKHEIDAAIQDVIDNTAFILGERVKRFEDNFATAHNVPYCLGTSSGTDSLHLALWALEIGPGDEVILPVNTFFATAEAVSIAGATPVFVDNYPTDYTINVTQIENKITSRTRAIIPVHLYGQSADMEPIVALAAKHGLFVIEDCAQSHLEEYKGKPTGSIGDIGCFSFYAGKNLGAFGEGGAVTTNNEDLYRKMAMIRDHGSSRKYHHDVIGHNYRLEGIQAAVLDVKLKYLAGWNKKRRDNALLYSEYLSDMKEIITPVTRDYAKHVFHLYVIRAERRDELQKYLGENTIFTGLHYPIPLHLQKAYSFLDYKTGDFPVAEKFAGEILSLPMFPELPREEIAYVCDHVRNFFR